jgi:ATP-dependent Clp protease ATP-binding subunit ClpC
MFEKFTDGSRKAAVLANQAAHRLGGNIIGDVELLIGLADTGTSVRILRDLGVDLASLRNELERQARVEPPAAAGPPRLPQTPQFKHAVQAAIAIAKELGDEFVGTPHLLLGILRHPEFESAQTLTRRGVSFDAVRDCTVRLARATNH